MKAVFAVSLGSLVAISYYLVSVFSNIPELF
jgi:hypothetical protein